MAYFIAAIALELALNAYLPLWRFSPSPGIRAGLPMQLAGMLLCAAGLLCAYFAIAAFIGHRTTIHPGQRSSALVTGGVFRLSRNPMYLAIVAVLSGLSLLLGSLSPWLAPLILFLALDRWFIPAEERLLGATFGEDYRAYRAAVRRWL